MFSIPYVEVGSVWRIDGGEFGTKTPAFEQSGGLEL